MRRLTRATAALALAAVPVLGAIAAVQPSLVGSAGPAAGTSSPDHVLADNGVINSKN